MDMSKSTDWGSVAIAGAVVYGLYSLQSGGLNPFKNTVGTSGFSLGNLFGGRTQERSFIYDRTRNTTTALPPDVKFRAGDSIKRGQKGFRKVGNQFQPGDSIQTDVGTGTVLPRRGSQGETFFTTQDLTTIPGSAVLRGVKWDDVKANNTKPLSTSTGKKDTVTKKRSSGGGGGSGTSAFVAVRNKDKVTKKTDFGGNSLQKQIFNPAKSILERVGLS